jgi:hypothetical protein
MNRWTFSNFYQLTTGIQSKGLDLNSTDGATIESLARLVLPQPLIVHSWPELDTSSTSKHQQAIRKV